MKYLTINLLGLILMRHKIDKKIARLYYYLNLLDEYKVDFRNDDKTIFKIY